MEKYKIEPLSDTVLEASGWNSWWSGSSYTLANVEV